MHTSARQTRDMDGAAAVRTGVCHQPCMQKPQPAVGTAGPACLPAISHSYITVCGLVLGTPPTRSHSERGKQTLRGNPVHNTAASAHTALLLVTAGNTPMCCSSVHGCMICSTQPLNHAMTTAGAVQKLLPRNNRQLLGQPRPLGSWVR